MTQEQLLPQNQHESKLSQIAAQHARQDAAFKLQLSRVPADLPAPLRHLLDTYILGRKLGGGTFGTVRAALHAKTRQRVAIKIISRSRMQQESGAEDKVRREINILRMLQHPHIVRLYEVIETDADIYLVLELVASGELFELLNERGRLHEKDARRFFQQLISGVKACHSAGVVHRDLKPENLLLTADTGNGVSLKIADFGLSNVMRDGHFLNTSCGSPNYAAPEVIGGRLYAGPEVDVWSCGCILFALLCGRLPFDDANIGRLFRAIKAGAFSMPTHLSPAARDLLQRMLTVDPLARITTSEVRGHPWYVAELPDYLRKGNIAAQHTTGPPLVLLPAVLGTLKQLGFNAQATADDVMLQQHSPASVAYHLLADAQEHAAHDGSNATSHGGSSAESVPFLDEFGPKPSGSQARLDGTDVRWHPGLLLRPLGGAPTAMVAVFVALAAHGCCWKRTALFSYRCRSPILKGQGSCNRDKPFPSAFHPGRGSVQFQVQLYSVKHASFIVDIQKLHGNIQRFLDLCCSLLAHVAAAAAAAAAAATSCPQDPDSKP